MDQSTVEAYLTRIRAAGDAAMRPCSLLTAELRSIAPQRVGTAHLFLRPRFLLADPTGSGKTPMTIAGFGYLKEKDPSLKLLVVTTKSAQFQWQRSIDRFMVGMRVEVIGHDAQKRRMEPAARLARYHDIGNTDIWITTYATLAKDEALFLTTLDNFVVVFDEAHWVKSHKQDKLYPAASHVSAKARSVWGLSATPISNDRLDELFSIMELIRPGTFGQGTDIAQRYSQFRRTYYQLRLVTPRWKDKKTGNKARPFYEVIGVQNIPHLQAIIDPFYLKRPKAIFDAGLPEDLMRIEDVLLDPKQRKLYNEIWKQEWPGVNGQKMLKIAAITKSQQALCAPELVGKPEIPNAKLSTLLDLLSTEFRDEKVVVYSKFVEALKVISTALDGAGILHTSITGGSDAQQRDAAQQRFQLDERVRVILVSDAGGEAVDLQAAGALILYDLPWSFGKFTQVRGRVHRIGSRQQRVLTLLLAATDTVDEAISSILARKETSSRTVLHQGNTSQDTTLQSLISQNTDNETPIDDLAELFATLQGSA